MNPYSFEHVTAAPYLAHDLAVGAARLGQQVLVSSFAAQEAWLDNPYTNALAPAGLLDGVRRRISANSQMAERLTRDFGKPEFDLSTTVIDGQEVGIKEEVVPGQDKPFGSLLHFNRESDRQDPPLLVVAPMSGHFATLLRGTVQELLPHHDVYITDWNNARDVPLEAGEFGLDEYIGYVEDFIEELGPDVNIVAVCQSTIPVLAAVSHLASTRPDLQPASLTLMGGPLDTAAAPTEVTELADKYPIEWFIDNMLSRVPSGYPGAGRVVYPGHVQLFNFMAMNPGKHSDAFRKLRSHLIDGKVAEAARITAFYDEYRAVCDLSGEFYIDTVAQVFHERELANGTMTYNGARINPGAITRTNVLTIEGANDDISAPGQTFAAHNWLTGLQPGQQAHYLQPGVGHYGIFNGTQWADHIASRITDFIRTAADDNGRQYSPISDASKRIRPDVWLPSV